MAASFPDSLPEGWSKSPVDPMLALAVFKPLRIREGYTLCAYQFYERGNGNGCVWAMPEDSKFPEPSKCTQGCATGFLFAPRPDDALDDVMEAIEGDGTPWSFLCASIFAREMKEFGAFWHGCDWSTHRILDKNPTGRHGAEHWSWKRAAPKEWRPAVVESKTRVQVEFLTCSELGGEAISRYNDTYRRPSYTFATKETLIATGQRGFVF